MAKLPKTVPGLFEATLIEKDPLLDPKRIRGVELCQDLSEVREPQLSCFNTIGVSRIPHVWLAKSMWIIVSPILPLRNPNHSILFPLVGWLIEGFEETPLTTGFYDDRWCTKPAFYFYRKDIMDQTWLLFSIIYGIILPIQLTNMVGTTNIDFHIFQRDWNHQPVSNCSILFVHGYEPTCSCCRKLDSLASLLTLWDPIVDGYIPLSHYKQSWLIVQYVAFYLSHYTHHGIISLKSYYLIVYLRHYKQSRKSLMFVAKTWIPVKMFLL